MTRFEPRPTSTPRGPGDATGNPALAAATATLVSLAFYLATLAPGLTFGDAGELIVAADGMGVAHPPGYPLWTLLAKVALLVPAGEPAWRTNVLSAVFGALACGTAARLASRWTGSLLAGLVAGLGLAVAPALWKASIATEVYSLHALLTVLLLDWAHRGGRAGAWGAGAAFGAGLAHHPTIVLVLPAAAVLAWGQIGRRDLARAILPAVAIPAALYGSLLPRARFWPEASWGSLRTLHDVAAHALALTYRTYDLGWGALALGQRWDAVLWALAVGSGGAALVLGIAGWASTKDRRLQAAGTLLGVVPIVFALRYEVDAIDVYLLPAVVGLLLATGLLASRLGRLAWAVFPVVVSVPLLWQGQSVLVLHEDRSPDAYVSDLLRSAPLGGVLLTEGDEAFLLSYYLRMRGDRPDVRVRDRLENMPDRISSREEADLLLAGGTNLLYHVWPGFPLPEGLVLEPVGLLYRVRAQGSAPVSEDPLSRASAEPGIGRLAVRSGDRFARSIWGSYSVMRGERRLFLGDRAGAEREFDEARRRAAGSDALRNYLGTVYGRIGDLARAQAEFEAALAARPTSVRARINLETVRALRRGNLSP